MYTITLSEVLLVLPLLTTESLLTVISIRLRLNMIVHAYLLCTLASQEWSLLVPHWWDTLEQWVVIVLGSTLSLLPYVRLGYLPSVCSFLMVVPTVLEHAICRAPVLIARVWYSRLSAHSLSLLFLRFTLVECHTLFRGQYGQYLWPDFVFIMRQIY